MSPKLTSEKRHMLSRLDRQVCEYVQQENWNGKFPSVKQIVEQLRYLRIEFDNESLKFVLSGLDAIVSPTAGKTYYRYMSAAERWVREGVTDGMGLFYDDEYEGKDDEWEESDYVS